MKYSPRFVYTFNPSNGTVNLSSNTGFNIAGLLAIIDTTANVLIYAASSSGLGYSSYSAGVLTLQCPTSALSSSDILTFIYDDGLASSAVIGSPNQLAASPQIATQNSYWGQLRVTEDPSELLNDTFDSTSTLDTANRWTTGGTVPTMSGGTLTVSPGTTTSAYSYLRSQFAFAVSAQSFVSSSNTIKIDTTVTTNNYRFWGFGTLPGTIASGTPLYDAVGFEIDTSGNLNCVIWAAGTKTYSTTVARPTDGYYHRYAVYFRGSRMYWQIDNNDVYSALVSFATSGISGPSSYTLPQLMLSVNASTAPTVNGTASTAVTFLHNSASVADYGRNNTTIADVAYGWRGVNVKAPATPATINDNALVTTTVAPDVIVAGTMTATDSVNSYVTGTGSFVSSAATANSTVVSPQLPGGDGAVNISLLGTFNGGVVYLEGSLDSTTGSDGNWAVLSVKQAGILNVAPIFGMGSAGLYQGNISGFKFIRVRIAGASSAPSVPTILRIAEVATTVAVAGSVNPPPITKGSQNSVGVSTQDLKDSGRNVVNYYMNIPVATTATDALQSLTGYKSSAAVAATTTPAVVSSGKTYRVTGITITYVEIATIGSVKVTLRANTAGAVAIGSPAVQSWVVGGGSATAGVTNTVDVDIFDGLEFASGTGIGISLYGLSATQAAAAVGYGMVSISGYEY